MKCGLGVRDKRTELNDVYSSGAQRLGGVLGGAEEGSGAPSVGRGRGKGQFQCHASHLQCCETLVLLAAFGSTHSQPECQMERRTPRLLPGKSGTGLILERIPQLDSASVSHSNVSRRIGARSVAINRA